ncbi:MAG: sulfur carrier protein ThiS [Acidobacteria bacterium]|nr:sulfur carrier protein ThiS [Acidobacteriota bacterium]MCB9397438.1 sulfur carrier protein ThiS [Acidobacteriota bacterium]
MNITLNGAPLQTEIQDLARFLNSLFSETRVAVAINGSFVPRAQFEHTQIHEGDELEVLSPMQGG